MQERSEFWPSKFVSRPRTRCLDIITQKTPPVLYYIAFPNDSLHLKIVVWTVYILELVETIMIASTLYQQFVYGFLDIRSLDRISNNWFAVPVLGGIDVVILYHTHWTKSNKRQILSSSDVHCANLLRPSHRGPGQVLGEENSVGDILPRHRCTSFIFSSNLTCKLGRPLS